MWGRYLINLCGYWTPTYISPNQNENFHEKNEMLRKALMRNKHSQIRPNTRHLAINGYEDIWQYGSMLMLALMLILILIILLMLILKMLTL